MTKCKDMSAAESSVSSENADDLKDWKCTTAPRASKRFEHRLVSIAVAYKAANLIWYCILQILYIAFGV